MSQEVKTVASIPKVTLSPVDQTLVIYEGTPPIITKPAHQDQQNVRRENSEEENENEDNEGMAEEYAGYPCHEILITDTCTSIFCPCITYGQILENLDPNITHKKHDDAESKCHVSTGCLLWTGLMGITLGGIQSLISIPATCAWMPTMYFGEVIDAREMILACSYVVPQLICHLPLRRSIVGSENCCCSCLISSFCCCCSLASLKSWSHENDNIKYTEDDVCMSKCCPCCGVFDTEGRNINSMETEPGDTRPSGSFDTQSSVSIHPSKSHNSQTRAFFDRIYNDDFTQHHYEPIKARTSMYFRP